MFCRLFCCCLSLCVACCSVCRYWFFFFQAEDGIRDLVRSRGLGDVYKRQVMGIEKPRVSLLNIGVEKGKGNLLTQSAYEMMHESKEYFFVGNIESRDLFNNKADVIVCDGFTGNILLKQIEAFYRIMQKRNLLDDYFERFNYENFGGSPILGLNGTVVLGHGISSAIAIKNMLKLSYNIATTRLSDKVKEALYKYSN